VERYDIVAYEPIWEKS